MDKVENTNTLKEKLLSLREKLNNEVAKNVRYSNKEEYDNLLAISKKLDDVIVKYIKSSNDRGKIL